MISRKTHMPSGVCFFGVLTGRSFQSSTSLTRESERRRRYPTTSSSPAPRGRSDVIPLFKDRMAGRDRSSDDVTQEIRLVHRHDEPLASTALVPGSRAIGTADA